MPCSPRRLLFPGWLFLAAESFGADRLRRQVEIEEEQCDPLHEGVGSAHEGERRLPSDSFERLREKRTIDPATGILRTAGNVS